MCDFKSIIRSPEFHFLVGHEQSHLTIHTGIVRNLSPPLYALINNSMMKESIEGTAILDDVEEGTFIGFCEFAYRGAYTTPDRRGEDNDGESGSFDGKKEEHQGRVHGELASDNPDAESSQRYAGNASGAEPELASAPEWDLHRVPELEAEEMPAQEWDLGPSLEPEPSRVRIRP